MFLEFYRLWNAKLEEKLVTKTSHPISDANEMEHEFFEGKWATFSKNMNFWIVLRNFKFKKRRVLSFKNKQLWLMKKNKNETVCEKNTIIGKELTIMYLKHNVLILTDISQTGTSTCQSAYGIYPFFPIVNWVSEGQVVQSIWEHNYNI